VQASDEPHEHFFGSRRRGGALGGWSCWSRSPRQDES